MAVTLELNSGAIAADLDLNAAVGAGIRMESWSQAVASPVYGGQPGPVKETMVLMVERTTHNLLAASIQALDEYRVQADTYRRDRLTEDQVWLECKMDDETGTRRALVLKIDESYRLPLYSGLCGPNQDTTRIKLELVRMPYWEDTARTNGTSAIAGGALSFVYDYTAGGGDVAGDVPARVADSIIAPAVAAAGALDRVWVGIRSANKHPTLATFEPIWECEDGTNGTDAADVTVQPTASNAAFVRITPGTATWARRMQIKLKDVTGGYSSNLGHFLWLLRAQVSAGTWEVELRFGYGPMADDDFVRGPIIEIADTAWNIYEAGEAALPMRDLHVISTTVINEVYEADWAVDVWARRTAGAGTLDLDCLFPITLDESYMVLKNIQAVKNGEIDECWFGTAPEGRRQAVVRNSEVGVTGFKGMPTMAGQLTFPPGDGRAYIVYADGATTANITQRIYATMRHYDCWLSLRGAE